MLKVYWLKKCEEAERFKEVSPDIFIQPNVIADIHATFELLDHDVTCGACHIEGGVLLGVSRGNDGH